MKISDETTAFAKAMLDATLLAANAKTPEERARVAWRTNDVNWRNIGALGLGFPRAFNNCVQDMNEAEGWPWVDNLWTRDEIVAGLKQQGFNDEQIARFVPAAKPDLHVVE